MIRNFSKRLRKEYILGGFLASGTLYFGYKNVSAYLARRSSSGDESQLNFQKNDVLADNLKKLYHNFNKCDLSLRNGDLVFIKYNLDKLGPLSRFKTMLVRNLAKNRIFDDVGVVYRSGDSYYVVLLPSVKLRSKSALRDLNIDDRRRRGVVAVEYDDLIRENHPDLVSIRRLICSEATREAVVKALKAAVLDLRSCVNSGLAAVFTSWASGLPYLGHDCSEFINALTYKEELEYARMSLKYSASDVLSGVQGSFDAKQAGPRAACPAAPEDAGLLLDSLIEYEKTLAEYDRDIKRYEGVIEGFLGRVGAGKAGERGRLWGTETSLVSRVYSRARLLPLRNAARVFGIHNYFELDSLYSSRAGQDPAKYSRLSAPFNVYTGGVNKIRLQNLRYPQIRDILDYKV